MTEAIFTAILTLFAGAIGKLWLESRTLHKEHLVMAKEHTECEKQLAKLTAQVEFLNREAFGQKVTIEDALVIADETGCITQWSPGAEKLFGFVPEEAVGQRISDLIVPVSLRKEHDDALGHLMRSPRTSITHVISDTRGLTKKGKEFSTDINVQGWKSGESWRLTAIFHPR